MATLLPLDGDGLVENLFYFLWCKDDFGAGPRIFVPHTVLFRFGQPAAWYFTSLRSIKVKRKAKVNLTNALIEHEFTKKRAPTDIVACYLYFAANNTTKNSNNGSSGAETTETTETTSATVTEYFDADALRDFLYRRDKSAGGMLQKFVLPKGTSNATVRAIWSPKICLLERRVNVRNVHDKRVSVYERGVTFDGPDLHSRPEPVRGAMLPGEVQLLCEQVVDHVTHVSYHKYRIARMVLHLKTDADDRLWLLWCSSLRLLHLENAGESGSRTIRPLDIVNDAQVPAFARLPFGQSHTHVASGASAAAASYQLHREQDEKRRGFARCMSCGQFTEQKKLLATNYRAVLDHFQRFLRFLRQHVNESEHAAIEWPPDERFVQAAGGVGFGILLCIDKDALSNGGGSSSVAKKAGGGGSSASSLTRKELVIPPVIQYLHPSFSVDDLERHRHDPLFLHKPVAVCESCCLVYSDYTTSSLEVNSIRQSAPAILRPHLELSDAKKRLDPLDPLATALAASQGREESFFRELHEQKDLERGHPLHHLLASATRLPGSKRRQLQQKAALRLSKTTAASSMGGADDGFGRSRSVGMLPELLEQQLAGRKAPSKSPYSVVLRLRESVLETDDDGDDVAGDHQANESSPVVRTKPSKTKNKTEKRAGAKKKNVKKVKEDGSEDEQQPNVGKNAAARFVSSREKKASEEHQAFLFEALAHAETQLDHIESLASLVPELAEDSHCAAAECDDGSDGSDDDSGNSGEEPHENAHIDGEHDMDELRQADGRDESSEAEADALLLEAHADTRADDENANSCTDGEQVRGESGGERTEELDRDQLLDGASVAGVECGDEADASDMAVDQDDDCCGRDPLDQLHVEEGAAAAACESGRNGTFESEQEQTQADGDVDEAERGTERDATEFHDDDGAASDVDHNETEQVEAPAASNDADLSADFVRFLDALAIPSSDTSLEGGLGSDSEPSPEGGGLELNSDDGAEQQVTHDHEGVVDDTQRHESGGNTQ